MNANTIGNFNPYKLAAAANIEANKYDDHGNLLQKYRDFTDAERQEKFAELRAWNEESESLNEDEIII